jgi:ketosteroid isomerase-like protein
MDETFAKSFASEWVEAWNAHDIERVLSHYTDNFELSSPIIVQLLGEPSGALRGKEAVGAYWRKALQVVPDLRFSAEVFDFNASDQIVKATTHYAI